MAQPVNMIAGFVVPGEFRAEVSAHVFRPVNLANRFTNFVCQWYTVVDKVDMGVEEGMCVGTILVWG